MSLEMESKLRQMAIYAKEDDELPQGTHFGFFGIRARVNSSGFDVLVNKASRSQLPSVSLSKKRLEPWHLDFLKPFNGLTAFVPPTVAARGAKTPKSCITAPLCRAKIQQMPASVPQRSSTAALAARAGGQPGKAFTSVSTKESGAGPALTTLCSTPAARA